MNVDDWYSRHDTRKLYFLERVFLQYYMVYTSKTRYFFKKTRRVNTQYCLVLWSLTKKNGIFSIHASFESSNHEAEIYGL